MKILKIDEKNRFLHVVPESSDDFWHLERVIEKGDLVSGETDRKIKPLHEGEKPRREKLFVELNVETVEFHKFSGMLRIEGTIVQGKPSELIEIGAHHSLELPLHTPVKVQKKQLLRFQIERLRAAAEAGRQPDILLVVLDDEQATFGLLKQFELQQKATIASGKSGKRFAVDESTEKKYFAEIAEKIKETKAKQVVVAGPGFTRSRFEKFLQEKGKPKEMRFFFAATNSTGVTGLQEMLKGGTLVKVVQNMQLVKETQLVERFLAELGKNSGLAEYGFLQVQKAIEFGAVQQLLVADKFFLQNREQAEKAMQDAERMGAEVHLINAEHEAGQQLFNLGGIAALLRYRIG